jgi:hypothetical protein
MSVKLRFVLPAVQMALAVGLICWSNHRLRAAIRLGHWADPSPAFTLCVSINAPIALPRALLFRHVSAFSDYVVLVVAVGMLWYWVALNIESLRREGKVLMFRWVPLRLACDLTLIAMAAFVAIAWVPEARPSVTLWPWPWKLSVVGSLLAWSFGLIFFFGRDLILCVRGTKPAQ